MPRGLADSILVCFDPLYMHTCAVQVAAILISSGARIVFVVLCWIEPFLSMHWSMRIVWLVYSVAQLVSLPAGLGAALVTGWSWHCWRQEAYARSGPASRPKAGVQAPRVLPHRAWVKH